MKSLPWTIKALAVTVALLVIVACATMMKGGGINFGEHHVEIHPTAHLSDADCKSLNDIVAKFDKRIYKIQTYEKGKVVGTRGNLSEKYMREGLVSEVMKEAEGMNFTGCALQAGMTSSTRKPNGGTSSTHPTPPAAGESMSGSSTHPTPAMAEATPGQSSGSSTHPMPPITSTSSTHKLLKESDRLVEELRPILEKYNKK